MTNLSLKLNCFLKTTDLKCHLICCMLRSELPAHTHRSTDGARSHQVSWSGVAAIDCVMGKLLLHGPVHVLEIKREAEFFFKKKHEVTQCYTAH